VLNTSHSKVRAQRGGEKIETECGDANGGERSLAEMRKFALYFLTFAIPQAE